MCPESPRGRVFRLVTAFPGHSEGDWKTGAGGLSPRIAASGRSRGCVMGEGEGVSDDRAELLAGIKAKAVIRGDFVLSSGRRADVYVDLRRVLLDGRLAPLAGRVMLDLTADLGYDAVGGLTLGADPVATAMID